MKSHRANVLTKERELQEMAEQLAQREAAIAAVVAQKDAEIARLSGLLTQTDVRIRQAVTAREEELRVLVMQRETEVREAMHRREEEILSAVRKREENINLAWQKREEELRTELSDAIQWVENRQKELSEEALKLEEARVDLEKKAEEMQNTKGPSIFSVITSDVNADDVLFFRPEGKESVRGSEESTCALHEI